MHALRMLWTHGLPSSSSSRWPERPPLPPSCMPRQLGGASRPSVIERLERLMGRLRRRRYLSEDAPSFAQMVKSAEKWMFEAIVTNPGHVLHHSLPREKSTGYNMRPRAHNFELRRKDRSED